MKKPENLKSKLPFRLMQLFWWLYLGERFLPVLQPLLDSNIPIFGIRQIVFAAQLGEYLADQR